MMRSENLSSAGTLEVGWKKRRTIDQLSVFLQIPFQLLLLTSHPWQDDPMDVLKTLNWFKIYFHHNCRKMILYAPTALDKSYFICGSFYTGSKKLLHKRKKNMEKKDKLLSIMTRTDFPIQEKICPSPSWGEPDDAATTTLHITLSQVQTSNSLSWALIRGVRGWSWRVLVITTLLIKRKKCRKLSHNSEYAYEQLLTGIQDSQWF